MHERVRLEIWASRILFVILQGHSEPHAYWHPRRSGTTTVGPTFTGLKLVDNDLVLGVILGFLVIILPKQDVGM
jgi:hypothetical protein